MLRVCPHMPSFFKASHISPSWQAIKGKKCCFFVHNSANTKLKRNKQTTKAHSSFPSLSPLSLTTVRQGMATISEPLQYLSGQPTVQTKCSIFQAMVNKAQVFQYSSVCSVIEGHIFDSQFIFPHSTFFLHTHSHKKINKHIIKPEPVF